MNKIKIYKNRDVLDNLLLDKQVGIIGYGNQGRAQALNLRDSGVNVVIGLRSSSASRVLAKNDGFKNILSIDSLVETSDVICFMVPDEKIPKIFLKYVIKKLTSKHTLLFSHGYCIHFNKIKAPKFVNIILVAPSGSGKMVRDSYLKGSGVPNLIAVDQDYDKNALKIAFSYSKAIGGTRIGAVLSTFEEETISDIFGEQTVLIGGIPSLMKASFDVLVESGYSYEVAWLVCYYEVKSIIDSFHLDGFDFLNNSISNLAEYGGATRGPFLIDDSVKSKMKTIIKDIIDGNFEKEWDKEKHNNYQLLNKKRKKIKDSKIEEITQVMIEKMFNN